MKATKEISNFFSGKKQQNSAPFLAFSNLNNSVSIFSLDEYIAIQDPSIISELSAYHSNNFLKKIPELAPCLPREPYLSYLTHLLNENQRNKYEIIKNLIAMLEQSSRPPMETPTRKIFGNVLLGMCINIEKLQTICSTFSIPNESLSLAWRDLLEIYAVPEEKYKDLYNSLIKKFHYGFYLNQKNFQVLNQNKLNLDIIAITWSLFKTMCKQIKINTKDPVYIQFVNEIKPEYWGFNDPYVCIIDLLSALEKRKLASGQYKNISLIFSQETMHAVDFEKIHTLLLETFTIQDSKSCMQKN